MPSAQDNANPPDTASQRQSFIQRARTVLSRMLAGARRNPLLAAVLLCGSTIIVGSGTSVVYYLVTHGPSSDRNVTTEAALALLDSGKYDKAKKMALRLNRKLEDHPYRLGYPLFIQGAVLAHEASELRRKDERQTFFLVAARYLQEARARGFPPGRAKEGIYLLASSLFKAGRFAESLPVLHEAYDALPNQKYELARLLSTAYVRDTAPNLKQALRYNRMWLRDPALSDREREEALLQKAEIYLALRDRAMCRETLSQIREDSPLHNQALLLEARRLMQEGDQVAAQSASQEATEKVEEKYRGAISALKRAQSKDTSGTTTRQSRYLLGICYQKLGDHRAAEEAFEQTRRMHYQTPEALAATLAQADLARQRGLHEAALPLYLEVAKEASIPATYRNDWVPLDELRRRLLAAQRHFAARGHFASAMDVVDACEHVVPEDELTAARGEIHKQWAEHMMGQASQAGASERPATRAEARRQFRLAAAQYRKLARQRFATPEYPADVWKSGTCFLEGQNYTLAREMLRKYLDNVPSKDTVKGLVALGECHLSVGHYHKALDVLRDCIASFPKHPESYRARLLANFAHQELGQLSKAKKLLTDNLHNYSLTPRSHYWQKSLMAYGKLLFQQAMSYEAEAWKLAEEDTPEAEAESSSQREPGYQELKKAHELFREAMKHLTEMALREEKAAALEERPPDSAEARYHIAETYCHLANLPRKSLENEPTEIRRNNLRQEIRSYLKRAARAYRELQQSLIEKQSHNELSRIEKRILRNTYFAYANTLFHLEDYEQAIVAYTNAANRYQHAPQALEALMQIASCYRRLNSPDEAREAVRQAEVVFSRVNQDADFEKTTRYRREEWEKLIDWLSQL